MAVIIDFAQAREEAGLRERATGSPMAGQLGEVVLFTGVRYERQANPSAEDIDADTDQCPTRQKKNS